LTGAAHRAAVLGSPIGHSLSPVLHRAGYRALGLTGWTYDKIECTVAELPGFVAGCGPEWAGLSLTMPLKEAALSVATEVSPVAAAVAAANTLVRRPHGWFAENTDVVGMVALLRTLGLGPGASFAVLGAGGTARAAVAAAGALGAGAVTVVARRPEAVTGLGPSVVPAPWPSPEVMAAADVVIATVPKGVADPLAAAVAWRPATVVFDAVYDPWPTPLADAAGRAGCPVLSGLDLLHAQALDQFRLFTGLEPPAAAMRAALVAART
jgi:shikimate dehydrogenase